MKRILCVFSFAFITIAASAATLSDCTKQFEPTLTNKLKSSTIDFNSATLASDITSILQPEFDKLIKSKPCQDVKAELTQQTSSTFSVELPTHIFDIELQFTAASPQQPTPQKPIDKPEELESLLPWYGILVVKKGSLDKYANSSTPIISTEYMKRNRDTFFPDNSDKPLGLWGGCTHSNHMADDDDIVNRAAHITFDEKDSFWTGNDYYVYDGEDVYWGTATLVGEIALALITLGGSTVVSASKATAQTAVATDRAIKAQRAITLAKRAEKLKQLEQSYATAGRADKAAKAAQLAKETRQGARLALEQAGAGPVPQLTNTATISNMARLLEASGVANETMAGAKAITWVSALAKPWRLIKPGMTALKPKNVAKLYGPGVTWGQRIKRAAITAGGVGLGTALIQAFGYSSASAEIMENVKFNSFGLLSADDLEGRDNVVSHGAWIQFEESGEINPNDTLNEALAFAEAFHEDMKKINAEDPQCEVDIYVVQPGISNPDKLGTREVYYVIQNPGSTLRVSK